MVADKAPFGANSSSVLEKLERKLIQPRDLARWAEALRLAGKSIATVNGCFDLLHPGHLHILWESSCQADVLLVALNIDQTIAQNKGPTRPIHCLADRRLLMAAIEWVDFVTYFEEATPVEFLKQVRPDVHINGAEYGRECVEAKALREFGGRLHLVESIVGYSTSKALRKAHQHAEF